MFLEILVAISLSASRYCYAALIIFVPQHSSSWSVITSKRLYCADIRWHSAALVVFSLLNKGEAHFECIFYVDVPSWTISRLLVTHRRSAKILCGLLELCVCCWGIWIHQNSWNFLAHKITVSQVPTFFYFTEVGKKSCSVLKIWLWFWPSNFVSCTFVVTSIRH